MGFIQNKTRLSQKFFQRNMIVYRYYLELSFFFPNVLEPNRTTFKIPARHFLIWNLILITYMFMGTQPFLRSYMYMYACLQPKAIEIKRVH